MAFLSDLLIRLRADTADFQSDMGKAAYMAERSMKRIQSAATMAFGGISIAALGYYTKSLINSAEQMQKMSERTGIGVGALSELKFAAALGDVEMTALGKAIGKFNMEIVEASNKTSKSARMFSALGVDITKGPNEALMQFAERASAIEDASVKTAVFRAALGKGGDELIPTFKNLKETTDQAKRLGITMSDETAKSAEKLNDSLKTLKTQSAALTMQMLSKDVGAMATMASNIALAAERGNKWLQVYREIQKLGFAAGNAIYSTEQGERRAAELFKQAPGLRTGEVAGKIGGLPAPVAAAAPNSEALAKILAENENKMDALRKRQIAALQQMEEKKRSLFNLTEEEITLQRLQTGTYKDFDEVTGVRLLNMAADLDTRAQLIDRIKTESEAMKYLMSVQSELDAIKVDSVRADHAFLDDLEFQNSLIWKTAIQQERMNEMRKVDLSLRQRLNALGGIEGLDPGQMDAAIVALTAQAENQKTLVAKGIAQRISLERDWSAGAKSSFDDYIDHATNAAEQSKMLFSNAFKNMEDALVNFVKTGKLDFASLADSIITDLIRIQIRQSMTKVMGGEGVGGLASGLGKILGFGASPSAGFDAGAYSAMNSFATGTDYVPKTGLYQLHQGEAVLTAAENAAGGSITFSPSIYIDSRTDSATIARTVDGAMRQSEARLVEQLNRASGPMYSAVRRA